MSSNGAATRLLTLIDFSGADTAPDASVEMNVSSSGADVVSWSRPGARRRSAALGNGWFATYSHASSAVDIVRLGTETFEPGETSAGPFR